MGRVTHHNYCQFLCNEWYCSFPNSAHIYNITYNNSLKKETELKYKYRWVPLKPDFFFWEHENLSGLRVKLAYPVIFSSVYVEKLPWQSIWLNQESGLTDIQLMWGPPVSNTVKHKHGKSYTPLVLPSVLPCHFPQCLGACCELCIFLCCTLWTLFCSGFCTLTLNY